MNALKRLFTTNIREDVFTPNTVAKLSYVNRSLIEDDLDRYLRIPGKQIILYGHSGSGKTTLLRNQLTKQKQNFIKTHCETSTTFEQLLLNAFDQLNRFYIAERDSNCEYTISTELKNEYNLIGTSISSSTTYSEGQKQIRILPPQLTPQKLSAFLGEINCVWVIEDFHKVEDCEKLRIADVVKIFIDAANDFPKVKIICIGAVGTARDLIDLDNNLNNRVAELLVPLLSDEEIEGIVNKGFELLNIILQSELKDKIVYYSNNLASIAHQICYDLCYNSKIERNKFFPKRLRPDSFKFAINSYVRKNSDTFTKIYDSVICESFGWNVLKAFEHMEKEHLSFSDISNFIPSVKRPNNEELSSFLDKLCSAEYKEIIRYDRNSDKFSLSSPFFKAFLKMKLAIEKSEKNDRQKKKSKKRKNDYSIDDNSVFPNIVLDEEFLIRYTEILDSIIESNNQIKLKIKKSKRDIS